MSRPNPRPPVVLAVPQSDCHVVGIKLLEFFLDDAGYDVHNLGVCTPTAEIAAAAAELSPLAVLLGSQNGHGLKDVADLRDRMAALGVPATLPVFIGGNLSVGAEKDDETTRRAFAAVGITVLKTFEEAAAALGRLSPRRPAAAALAG